MGASRSGVYGTHITRDLRELLRKIRGTLLIDINKESIVDRVLSESLGISLRRHDDILTDILVKHTCDSNIVRIHRSIKNSDRIAVVDTRPLGQHREYPQAV